MLNGTSWHAYLTLFFMLGWRERACGDPHYETFLKLNYHYYYYYYYYFKRNFRCHYRNVFSSSYHHCHYCCCRKTGYRLSLLLMSKDRLSSVLELSSVLYSLSYGGRLGLILSLTASG